mgnify:CR=1 FL=1
MSKEKVKNDKVNTEQDILNELAFYKKDDLIPQPYPLYKAFVTLITKASSLEEFQLLKTLIEQYKESFTSTEYTQLKMGIGKMVYKKL